MSRRQPETWPPHPVVLSRERLKGLRHQINSLNPAIGVEIEGALCRFLAVRACGHVEYVFDECLATFVERISARPVGSYVRSGLFSGRNPRPAELVARLSRLDVSWGSELEGYLNEDDQKRSRELAFLVSRRNAIAHGQNEGLNRRKALDVADLAIELGDWFVIRLTPS